MDMDSANSTKYFYANESPERPATVVNEFAELRNNRTQLEPLNCVACNQAYLHGRSSERADVITISSKKSRSYNNSFDDLDNRDPWYLENPVGYTLVLEKVRYVLDTWRFHKLMSRATIITRTFVSWVIRGPPTA